LGVSQAGPDDMMLDMPALLLGEKALVIGGQLRKMI
jgi:hypothetical protein